MSALTLGQELLDDFFTEADQHLLDIRGGILQLERSYQEAHHDGKTVGELFFSFHSFKGIAAIVGLASAESLAHAAEDLLRLVRDGQLKTDGAIVDVLNTSTRKLEQIVAAFRAQDTLPDFAAELEEIRFACAAHELPKASATPNTAASEAIVEGEKKAASVAPGVLKFTFAPTRELSSKKININTIREDLARVGEILTSAPVVLGQGVIRFEFLIAPGQEPIDEAVWAAKGVTIEAPVAPAPPSSVIQATTPTTGEVTHNPFLSPSHVVRVDLKRLDDLVRLVGEMVIHRSRLDVQLARLASNGPKTDLHGVQEANGLLGRSLRQMRDEIMRIRLIPIGEIFARMPFVISDLSRQSGKKVLLKFDGQETALDKYLIEKLKDPLLHMVRNAFSHGIETLAERRAHSKPEEASIHLSASTVGSQAVIKVRDDGRGIDPQAVVRKAQGLRLPVPAVIDDITILALLCSPGFSTCDRADHTSGRGVGMSVVKSVLDGLGGKLSFESKLHQGTLFTLRLPLTVVIADTLLVSAAGQTCAVPQSSVIEIVQISEAEIRSADGSEIIAYRGGVLPITRLAGLFNLRSSGDEPRFVLVVTSDRGSIGLLVEKLLGQREVVVRTFRDPLIEVNGISGATELGDGKPVLILDEVALTSRKVRPFDSLDFVQNEARLSAPTS